MTAGGTWGVAPTRRIIRALLRALGSIAVLVAAYYILPLDRSAAWAAVLMLVVGLAVLIALIMYQVRSIARTKYPRLRAIEALATSVPFFLVLFASAYVVMAHIDADNFSEHI